MFEYDCSLPKKVGAIQSVSFGTSARMVGRAYASTIYIHVHKLYSLHEDECVCCHVLTCHVVLSKLLLQLQLSMYINSIMTLSQTFYSGIF